MSTKVDSLRKAYYSGDWDEIERLAMSNRGLLHAIVVDYSCDLAPDSVTILQDLVRNQHPDRNALILRLLRLDPTLAQDVTTTGDILPVQLAALNECISLEAFQALADAFPQGIQAVDDQFGSNVLHDVLFFYHRSPEIQEEKLLYLLDHHPQLAADANDDGNYALHMAVSRELCPRLLRRILDAHPTAVRQRNAQGNYPLDLALAQLPWSRDSAKLLLDQYDPDPSKPKWLNETRSQAWLRQNFSPTWIDRQLALDLPEGSSDKEDEFDDDESAFDSEEESDNDSEEESDGDSEEESDDDSEEESSSCDEVSNNDDDVSDSDSTNDDQERNRSALWIGEPPLKKSKTDDQFILPFTGDCMRGDEMIINILSLGWLDDSPKDARAISAVSTFLQDQVVKMDKFWKAHWKRLNRNLTRPPKLTRWIPREFADPRFALDFGGWSFHQKYMHLGQYKAMVLDYLRAPIEDDEFDAVLAQLLERIRATVRLADRWGFFEEPHDDDDHAGSGRPAHVDESLARCTMDKLKQYIVNDAVEQFRRNGIFNGWIFSAVAVGWADIQVGRDDDFDYVSLCHKIAGLGVVRRRRNEWGSW